MDTKNKKTKHVVARTALHAKRPSKDMRGKNTKRIIAGVVAIVIVLAMVVTTFLGAFL